MKLKDGAELHMSDDLVRCNECSSLFMKSKSKMMSLCPECAHYLYEYENCTHLFEQGRCVKCYWDGSTSEYLAQLKRK